MKIILQPTRLTAGIVVSMIFLFACAFPVSAQINVAPGPDVTPMDMVENIVGEGITYDNVTFQGADVSRGIFSNGGSTNLGIESGIFLTSGAAYFIPGPNTATASGQNNGTGGDATLNGITTSTTYDAAVLEFDFIPESDTMRFKYVFGSEEYNEWVNSSFNDVFGYFVSGPNPEGGFYSDKNIALVPGTTTTVTINNVNNGYSPGGVVPTGPCMNCEYYTDNTGGVTLQYDGKTVVMIAYIIVVPCETYHIKIGVADAGDGIYDTGVFIEENSFESPKIEVETEPYPQGVSDNMIEGCVEADIIFKLPNPEYAPITVYFEVGGTADPVADFEEPIPDFITFEEGEDTAFIHVAPIKDGLIEGIETLELIIENTLGCIVRYDTVVFEIFDYVDMITEMSPPTFICQGQEIDVYVNTFNGIPTYTYEWEGFEGIDNDTITVSPDTTTTYIVSVFDLCQDSIIDSTTVTVFPLPDINLGDTAYICNGDTAILNAGGGYLGYLWHDGSTDTVYYANQQGLHFVTVTGPGGCTTTDSIFVKETVVEVDLMVDTVNICIGDTAFLYAGNAYPSYVWQDGSTGSNYNAMTTGWYWVEAGFGGCTDVDSAYVYVDDPNLGFTLGADTAICIGDNVTLFPKVGVFNSYEWSTGDTTFSITVNTPGTYTLTVQSGCGEATDQIVVSNLPEPDPNLGDDLILCYGESATLSINPGQFSTWAWQDNSSFNFYTVYESGVYWVDVTDYNGCDGSDTVEVTVANVVDLGPDTLLCTGDSITFFAGNEFDNFIWSTGEFGTPSVTVQNGGYVYVDVNYNFGCPSSDTVFVDEKPVPAAEITGPNIFCTGDTLYLNAPEGPYEYFWNEQSGETSLMITQGGTYTLKMMNACGESTDALEVVEHPLPDVDLGQDILLFPGESKEFNAGDFETYTWNDILGGQFYSVTYDDIDGTDSLYLEVFDGFCVNKDGILIEAFNVQIPLAFSPNGDGSNDTFTPILNGWHGIKDHNIMVFNRWGEKVWESSDFLSGWDGKRGGSYVADGTYFWLLEVFYGPASTKKVYKGTLTVLGTTK